jgi:hypothetical protein
MDVGGDGTGRSSFRRQTILGLISVERRTFSAPFAGSKNSRSRKGDLIYRLLMRGLVVRSLIAGGLSTPFRDASAGVIVLFAVVHSIGWMVPHDGVQWRDVSM